MLNDAVFVLCVVKSSRGYFFKRKTYLLGDLVTSFLFVTGAVMGSFQSLYFLNSYFFPEGDFILSIRILIKTDKGSWHYFSAY